MVQAPDMVPDLCMVPDPHTVPGLYMVPDPDTVPDLYMAPDPDTAPGLCMVPDPHTVPGLHNLPNPRLLPFPCPPFRRSRPSPVPIFGKRTSSFRLRRNVPPDPIRQRRREQRYTQRLQ